MTHTLYCQSANRFGEGYDCICPKPAAAEPSKLSEATKQRLYELESALADAERRLEDAQHAGDLVAAERDSWCARYLQTQQDLAAERAAHAKTKTTLEDAAGHCEGWRLQCVAHEGTHRRLRAELDQLQQLLARVRSIADHGDPEPSGCGQRIRDALRGGE